MWAYFVALLGIKVYTVLFFFSYIIGRKLFDGHFFFLFVKMRKLSQINLTPNNIIKFYIRWPKYWSFSISMLMSIQDCFPSGLTGLILQPKGLSRVFSSTTIQKHQFFGAQPFLRSNSHIHTWWLEKPKFWLYGPLSATWFLVFNTSSRFIIAFLPRSQHLLISWLQSPSTVILEFKKIKSDTLSIVSPSICPEVMGPDAMILVFWMCLWALIPWIYSAPPQYHHKGFDLGHTWVV